MKKLDSLDNVERAKTIAQLFPEEMPAMVKAIEEYCNFFISNQDSERDKWNISLFNFESWIEICSKIVKSVEVNKKGIYTKPSWFADNLFDGFYALVSSMALQRMQTDNQKLSQAIKLFFG